MQSGFGFAPNCQADLRLGYEQYEFSKTTHGVFLCFTLLHQFHSTEVRNASRAPRGAFLFRMPFSSTLFDTPTLKAPCVFVLFFFSSLSSCTHHCRDGSSGPGDRRGEILKAVHLKSRWTDHYFWSFFTFSSSASLYSGCGLVIKKKNIHQCNKRETGVSSVYFYFPT